MTNVRLILFYSMVFYGIVWYGGLWYGMVWYGICEEMECKTFLPKHSCMKCISLQVETKGVDMQKM